MGVICWVLNIGAGGVNYNKPQVNGRYPVGTIATFYCNSGYDLSETSSTTCQSSGHWAYLVVMCTLSATPSPTTTTPKVQGTDHIATPIEWFLGQKLKI